jgi:hypothetical protein
MKAGCYLVTRKNSFSTGDRESDTLHSPPVEEEAQDMEPHGNAEPKRHHSNEEIKIIEPNYNEFCQQSMGEGTPSSNSPQSRLHTIGQPSPKNLTI